MCFTIHKPSFIGETELYHIVKIILSEQNFLFTCLQLKQKYFAAEV